MNRYCFPLFCGPTTQLYISYLWSKFYNCYAVTAAGQLYLLKLDFRWQFSSLAFSFQLLCVQSLNRLMRVHSVREKEDWMATIKDKASGSAKQKKGEKEEKGDQVCVCVCVVCVSVVCVSVSGCVCECEWVLCVGGVCECACAMCV